MDASSPVDVCAEQAHVSEHFPKLSVNLRDLGTVSDTIRSGICIRSSQVISPQDVDRLNIRTVLDLRKAPILCKTHPNNSAQIMRHALFKGRIWFAGVGQCHIRLQPSTLPDHNRSLPCQRCTGLSEQVYGHPAVVYHVDFLPTSVAINILRHLPHRLQLRVVTCAMHRERAEPMVAAAIADPGVMGWFEFYKILLRKSRRPLARALRLFANPGAAPVLVHCVHGKDRTGLVAMLLLLLCDVPPKAIVKDYVRSELILRQSRDNNELVSIPQHLTTNNVMSATDQVMDQVMAYLDSHYGGPVAYVKKAGITDDEIASIRKTLMKTPAELEASRAAAVKAAKPEAVAAAAAAQAAAKAELLSPSNPEDDPDFTTRISIGQYSEEQLPPIARETMRRMSAQWKGAAGLTRQKPL